MMIAYLTKYTPPQRNRYQAIDVNPADERISFRGIDLIPVGRLLLGSIRVLTTLVCSGSFCVLLLGLAVTVLTGEPGKLPFLVSLPLETHSGSPKIRGWTICLAWPRSIFRRNRTP